MLGAAWSAVLGHRPTSFEPSPESIYYRRCPAQSVLRDAGLLQSIPCHWPSPVVGGPHFSFFTKISLHCRTCFFNQLRREITKGLLHHRQVFQVFVGLEQHVACEQFVQNAAHIPHITGVERASPHNDFGCPVLTRRGHRRMMFMFKYRRSKINQLDLRFIQHLPSCVLSYIPMSIRGKEAYSFYLPVPLLLCDLRCLQASRFLAWCPYESISDHEDLIIIQTISVLDFLSKNHSGTYKPHFVTAGAPSLEHLGAEKLDNHCFPRSQRQTRPTDRKRGMSGSETRSCPAAVYIGWNRTHKHISPRLPFLYPPQS